MSVRPTRKQQQPVATSLPPIPVDQIIQIRGRNPLAEGITNTADVLMKALADRDALRRQAYQAQSVSDTLQKIGVDTSGMTGATPDQMLRVGELKAQLEKAKKMDLNSLLEEKVRNGEMTLSEAFKMKAQSASQPKQSPPKVYGSTPEGSPVFLDPGTGSFVSNGQPYNGQILPVSVGTEESRRSSLVSGAVNSIGRVRELLTPAVLNELKAIRNSPGKSYAQIASAESRELYSNLQNALANELYLKTGATANPDELERTANMYMASLADNPSDFLVRMNMLEGNVLGFNLRGSGIKKPQTTPIPEISSDADFEKLPKGALFIAPDGTQRRKP